jgi:serine phosphatase RsbU (regulator of sigma subunit)
MPSRETIRRLVEALAEAEPAQIPAAMRQALAADGIVEATIWIADIGGRRLVDLAGALQPKDVEGTLAGRSYQNLESIASPDHLVTPLESLGRVIGVLELAGSGLVARSEEMRTAAKVISDRLIGAKGHSDVVERARGASHLGLAATIQYDLMPIPSYMSGDVEIGGWLEPAYDIAGDAWDYAVNEDEVMLGIFDSVGHGLRSCQLSTIALGSFRLARRRGLPLTEIAAEIEEGLSTIAEYGEFITATMGRATPSQRKLELANSGHLAPIRIRDGKATRLKWQSALPLGLDGKEPAIHSFDIHPGDSFYLFSDGVIEALDDERTPFGADTLSDRLEQSNAEERTVSATCRGVLDAVSADVGGPLRDDATVLGVKFT